jgi:hypothetical protein
MRARQLPSRRGLLCAAVVGGLLLLPPGASASPNWVPAINFPVPSTDVLETKPNSQLEIAYQNGGIANEAFLQIESISPIHTTLHVGRMLPGGLYTDQLTIPSVEGAIPAGVQLAVAPNGAAVIAWLELTGPNLETSPYRYRAAYRPAGSSTWEAPFTLAVDTERNKAVSTSLLPVISANGTAAVGVLHYASELGTFEGQPVARLDVAVHPAGGGWTPAVRLTGAKVSAESAALSTDAEGNLTAAYQSRFSEGGSPLTEDDRYQAIVRRRPASSGVWGPREEITPEVANHSVYALHLGEDEAGDAVLAFQYGVIGSPFNATAVTRQGANGSWTVPTQLVAVPTDSGPVNAGVAPNGMAYVLYWFQGESSGQDCEGVVRGMAGGATFTPHRCVSPTNLDTFSGSIAFLGNDAYFAWNGTVPGEASNGSVQGARWPNANSLPDVATNFDPQGFPYGSPNLISDRQGSVVAFYTSPSPGVLRAAAYDGGPPVLLGANVPTTATVGQSVPFSASFVDLWSGLGASQPVWSFGDGSLPASGASVAHTFSAAGTYTVTLGAIDALGNATSTTYTVTVSPPPSPKAGRPVVRNVHESASRFRAGTKTAQISRKRKKPPVGTTFSFRLNERASIAFTFSEGVKGRKVGKRCLPGAPKGHKHKRCLRTVTVGTLSFVGHPGLNRVVFQGRISASKRLKPGRYTLSVVATNSAAESSRPVTLSFTIVK